MAEDVTLCILAGGEARRMGHAKAEIAIGGKPILAHLLDRLQWNDATMLVTAPGREHPPGWERFDCELIDPIAGAGPLRGLLTALEGMGTEMLLLASVDMPLIERGQLRFLMNALRNEPAALGMMTRHIVLEPFPSIYRRAAIDAVRHRLKSDRRSLTSLMEESGFLIRNAPTQWDGSVWTNLNTPEDVKRFKL